MPSTLPASTEAPILLVIPSEATTILLGRSIQVATVDGGTATVLPLGTNPDPELIRHPEEPLVDLDVADAMRLLGGEIVEARTRNNLPVVIRNPTVPELLSRHRSAVAELGGIGPSTELTPEDAGKLTRPLLAELAASLWTTCREGKPSTTTTRPVVLHHPDTGDEIGRFPDLSKQAAAHARLVTVLDRLADATPPEKAFENVSTADAVPSLVGDVVMFRHGKRLRFAIVAELGTRGDPSALRVAYLTPTALDEAQQHWCPARHDIEHDSFPVRQVLAAQRAHVGDPTAQWQAAQTAFRDAVFAQAVARDCVRRPWAAVVPVRYSDTRTTGIVRAADQTLAWH